MKQNYKKAFEWIVEQIDSELKWAKEGDFENEGTPLEDPRVRGMIAAYSSIKRLTDNIIKYGADEYEKICEETSKRF